MFEGVNAIQGILCLVYHGSIQIIANIPGSESPDCVRIQNVECLNGCVNGISLENQVTEKLHMIIWNEHNNNDEICTLDSGDDVGFSFVSGIRHGLHFCAGPSRDSPFKIQKCFDKKSKRSVVFLRKIGE